MTLRRSVLHQGIVVAFLAAGLGFVLNTLIATGVVGSSVTSVAHGNTAIWPVVWALCVWVYVAVPAVRLALSVPIEPRANWIFRMTEDPEHRAWAIGAAVTTVWRLGVAIPVLAMGPILWVLSGPQAIAIVSAVMVGGWLLVEIHMGNWSRIPFTCGYIPGKGFVPQMFVKALGMFLIVPPVMTTLIHSGVAVAALGVVLLAMTAAAATVLLIRRRRRSCNVPLAFEDDLPIEINVLRLGSD